MRSLLKHIPALAAVLTLWLLSGCRSKTECIENVSKVGARVYSVVGPESMQNHEQIALTVGVRNDSLRCVREATAYFTNIGLDTLLVTAQLSYLANPTADCDCRRDSIMYTLLYFTPLDTGTYTITTGPDSSITTNAPGDGLQVNIRVD